MASRVRYGVYAEPLEERRPIGQEARGGKPIGKALPLEIDGREGKRRGYCDISLFQTLALPALRGRIIDFEYADILIGIAQREGIEAGAEHDDLAHAARDTDRQRIFRKPAARGDEQPHRPQRRIGGDLVERGAGFIVEDF